MRRQLLGVLVAMVVLLMALPLTASAANNTATVRLTASSYTDLSGRETDSLCAVPSGGPRQIAATISVHSVGALRGSGTLDATVTLYGTSFDLVGEGSMNGFPIGFGIYGVPMTCVLPDYAVVAYSQSGNQVSAAQSTILTAISIIGTMSDGVHPSQGSISLTIISSATSGSPR